MRVATTTERGPVATMPSDQVNAEFSHLMWTNFSGPDKGDGQPRRTRRSAPGDRGVSVLGEWRNGVRTWSCFEVFHDVRGVA